MSIKDRLRKISAMAAFTAVGLTSAFGIGADNIEVPQGPAPLAPTHHVEKQPVSISTFNGEKYLVPNAGDTLKSYRDRLKNDAPKADQRMQDWQKSRKMVPNTAPVNSVIDLYKKDPGAYLDFAAQQISHSGKGCSEDEAWERLQDQNNPWITFAKQVQKEQNAQKAVTNMQSAQR